MAAPPVVPTPLIERLSRMAPGAARRTLRSVDPIVAAAWAVQLADEVPRRARADLAQGDRLASAALTLARRSGDATALARALRADGHRHALHARHQRALGRYTRAAALFAARGESIQLAVTSSGSLQTLIYLGLYDRAFRDAARARAIFRRANDAVRLARLDSNVGNIYFRQDRFARALTCYQRAEQTMRSLGQHQDVAVALRNMAVCLTSLNRFDAALATYQEARRYCAMHGLSLLVAEVDYNVAYLHFLGGAYDQALRAYAAARDAAEAMGDRYHRTLCDLDEAEVCLELNDAAGASQRAADAAQGFAVLGMRYERAKSLAFHGMAQARLGDLALALASYRRARSLFAADGNAPWVALVDLARASTLFGRGRVNEAARYLATPAGTLAPTGRVLRHLLESRIALRRGQLAVARRATTAALDRLRTLDAPNLQWQAHLARADVREASGDVSGAIADLRRARRAFETLRSQISGDALKVSFLADKLDVYEHLVRLTLAATPASRARDEHVVGIIEDAKSRSLADLLAFRADDLAARSAAGDSAGAVRALRRQVLASDRRMARDALREGSDRRRQPRARASGAGRERQWAAAVAALGERDAGLAAIHGGGSASIDAIRAALPAQTTLLEYYVADGVVYAVVLSADHLVVQQLGALADVDRVRQLLRFQLAKFQLGPDYVRTFSRVLANATHRHLEDLHALLVAPLRAHLRTRDLVIVPHGSLHYVPFHALFDGREYLLDAFAVSYAPSASVYRLCQMAPPSAHEGSLVLAVADGYAPHIRREAAEVSQALPECRTFVGDEARIERLTVEGRTSRIIHLATHGFFRRDNPMLSSVRLADGQLTLADLYTLSLDADLVTLSGCGTGLSAVVGGDELVGLMRGLLYAGARSLLLTMWQVDDFSTAEFMSRFYAALAQPLGRADAVASAMRAIRHRFPHPYYWAPFMLVGQTHPPYISRAADVPMSPKGSGR